MDEKPAIEEYIKQEIEKRYMAYIHANSCPKCNILMAMMEDEHKTTFCLVCGHTSIFKDPE